jgi:hypothetical protein
VVARRAPVNRSAVDGCSTTSGTVADRMTRQEPPLTSQSAIRLMCIWHALLAASWRFSEEGR